MKQKSALLILALSATLGCATISAKRTPKLDKSRVAPELHEPAGIRLVVQDCTGWPKRTTKSIERARKKFSYLDEATENTDNPAYTIDLTVEWKQTESDFNEWAYASLLLFPAFDREELTVKADIRNAEGTQIGTVQSIGTAKHVTQMHLLWVLPVAVPLSSHVERKMWTRSFRDVFLQAAELISGDQQFTRNAIGFNATRVPSSSSEDRVETARVDRRRG